MNDGGQLLLIKAGLEIKNDQYSNTLFFLLDGYIQSTWNTRGGYYINQVYLRLAANVIDQNDAQYLSQAGSDGKTVSNLLIEMIEKLRVAGASDHDRERDY